MHLLLPRLSADEVSVKTKKYLVSLQINGKEETKKKIVCELRVYPKKTYIFTDKMIYAKKIGLCEQRVIRRTREGLCE